MGNTERNEEAEAAIRISGLCKTYEGFSLKDVSLTVPKGSIMGFIGQNGAGKTTTIRALLNMIPIDSGEISLLGCGYREDAVKEEIGVVFDEMGFHRQLTAAQLNKMFRHIYKHWDESVFFLWLERLGLPPKRKIGKFSRGMQMKLQIAVALSHHAKLLILDEPTSGLDPIVRHEMLDVFLDFVQDEEHAILLSSHITSDLERIADYITFIDKGRILLSGERIDILENHHLIKCKKEQAGEIPPQYIVGKHVTSFGAEVLVKGLPALPADFVMEEVNLEEIMVYYAQRRDPTKLGGYLRADLRSGHNILCEKSSQTAHRQSQIDDKVYYAQRRDPGQ